MKKVIIIVLLAFWQLSCSHQESEKAMFRLLASSETGIDFSNEIKPTKDLNIFSYLYFYNGGGAAAADLNNDGLIDLIFTANLGENQIYLNKGGLKFEDITSQTGFDTHGGWSNGVSVVDINNDGLLDFYVSQVGDYDQLQGRNQLFVCQKIENGIPKYEEKAAEYGLDLKTFATQAAFVDFDLDGDLDFFQLNHSVHRNATFGERKNYVGKFHPLSGDRYFENVSGRFIDKTPSAGIASNALGYGLGIVAGDVNLDGKHDLYIGNDFHENDYLYINQGAGLFKDLTDSFMNHTSRFSMGVDIADINNDLFPEIISLDMLPYEYKLVKMADGEDMFYNFNFKLKQGYNFQFSRNALQLNNGNNTFTDIAMFADVHATDWSWSSLFVDFDNDGFRDLFISNGINKRMNDTDYMNYVSNDAIQQRINKHDFDESDKLLADLLPEVKIPNKFFKNQGDTHFTEVNNLVTDNQDSFSNGAIYADLDNDGDLDIVTNNINAKAFVYENLSDSTHHHLSIQVFGDELNKRAVGTKVIAYVGSQKMMTEKFPVRGFQSSADIPLHLGLGKAKNIDSLTVIWPDNTFETLKNTPAGQLKLQYKKGLKIFDYQKLSTVGQKMQWTDVANEFGLNLKHDENDFNEFDRESLIPNMNSSPGPAIAVADINHDGLEDFFFGSSKWKKPKVMIQTATGKFIEMPQPALYADSTYEESDAQWADLNSDGHLDLLLADGGNEYYGKTPFLKPRIYLNDGTGLLRSKPDALPDIFDTQASIESCDFDGDGDLDIFIGNKTTPWAYGAIPRSYLLENNGMAKFTDKTPKDLQSIGMVKDAKWIDYDQDGDQDLILALQWDGVFCFENNKGILQKKTLTNKKGWWNTLYPTDLDGDGDLDFLLGNLGENSRIKASEQKPVRLYVNDMDDNGRLDQIMTHFMNGEEVLFADKKELEKQMPMIRKKYNLSKDFANADFKDIFGKDKIKNARVLEVNFFSNARLINQGNGKFEIQALPTAAQYAPVNAFMAIGQSGDYLSLGNFYESNIQLGRYDGSFGQVYHSKTNSLSNMGDFKVRGQVRNISAIQIQGKTYYLVAQNDSQLLLLALSK